MLNPKEQLIKKVIEENPGLGRISLGRIAYSIDSSMFVNVGSAQNAVKSFKEGRRLKYTGRFEERDSSKEEQIEQIVHKSSHSVNKSLALTEEQLRIMFDIKVIVKNALGQLKEGEFWMDQDFVKRFGLHGKPGMRQALESIEASKFRGKAGGKVIWSHPNSIEKMKNEGILI